VEAIKTPNTYLDTLNTMKFEYDPQSDPEYLRNAAALENQVAQMMVGRGGLYSSVASSALQSRMINLQAEYMNSKRAEFNEQRNFALNMAKFEADRMNQYFNQLMSVKQQSQSEQNQEFNQNMKMSEFEAQQALDQWNKDYKTAQFNADIYYKNQDLAMERERLEIQRANAIADAQIANEKANLATRAKNLTSMIALYTEERKKLDEAEARANETPPMLMNSYLSMLQKSEATLAQAEQRIKAEALEIGQYSQTLDMLNAIRQEPAPVKIGTQTAVSGTNASGDYNYISTTTPVYK
jgi:6-pyruvoyl-tetrahydropterin synthase